MWPTNLACLLSFPSIALYYYRYFQLTRWCRGKASALGTRCSVIKSWLRQGFFCFVFVVVCFTLRHYDKWIKHTFAAIRIDFKASKIMSFKIITRSLFPIFILNQYLTVKTLYIWSGGKYKINYLLIQI